MEDNEKNVQLKDEKLQDVTGGNSIGVPFVPTVEGPVFEFPKPTEEELKELQKSLRPCNPYYIAATGVDGSIPHCSQPDKAGTPGYCDGCEYMKWLAKNGK